MLDAIDSLTLMQACHARLMLLDPAGSIRHLNPPMCKLLDSVNAAENGELFSGPAEELVGAPLPRSLGLSPGLAPATGAQRIRIDLASCRLEAAATELAGKGRTSQGWLLTWRRGGKAGAMPQDCFIKEMEGAVEAMARCDLRPLETQSTSPHTATFYRRLGVGLANLAEAMRQNRVAATTISATAGEISAQNSDLAERTKEQARAIEATGVNMEELTSTVRSTAENALDAANLATTANRLADEGRQEVLKVVESMATINHSSDQVQGIIDVINQIAFQTNILALNAAVEAARAGEHGRGFSVVATEVRALAQRSSNAANEIKGLIEESLRINDQGKRQAVKAEESMIQVVEGVRETSRRIDDISAATREQHQGIEDAKNAVNRIDEITRKNQQLETELAEKIQALEAQDAFLKSATQVFRLPDSEFTHPLHEQVSQLAKQAAQNIGQCLEANLARGELGEADLFEVAYRPIPDTDPPKYNTGFDNLADRDFPAIQEDLLQAHPELIYAIAADHNGYVPTHNDRFTQPLTGDYDSDFTGNRTKRIFDDPVGIQVGRHTDEYRLQTYRRDTGELMFDLSAPVYVNGQHWGGFRIGYRIE